MHATDRAASCSNTAMERIEVELLTDGGNDAVVRMPGRQFPGMVIQGDSLSILQFDLAEIRDLCRAGDTAEALACAEILLEQLDEKLLHYTEALERHGFRRPFWAR
jgi:hypothetical protein